MPTVQKLSGLEILDSRGRPTVSATCELAKGVIASASVPSGVSTGAAEAHELRDGDPKRYAGAGCQQAVSHINRELHQAMSGKSYDTQADFDRKAIELDGTKQKTKLGANAILACSLAFARASAIEAGVPLYTHFANMIDRPLTALPRMTINLFSGGKHAGGQVPIQDILIVPVSATTIDQGLNTVAAVYQAAVRLIQRKYQMRWLTADEGGLAPPATSAEQMLDDAVEAIAGAGFEPGKDVAIAVDVASSHFFQDGRYELNTDSLTSSQMIDRIAEWVNRYPIVSVEDGLSEEDWAHWPTLREKIAVQTSGGGVLVLGDDLLCTNPGRIMKAIDVRACDALLLKVNQIGTLTEAGEAYNLARQAGWRVTISARSGETEDNWLADLATGWGGDQIKVGSINQSERLAKYNRLLAIEAESGLPVNAWPGLTGIRGERD